MEVKELVVDLKIVAKRLREVTGYFDSVGFSRTKGVIVKRGFFYSHGGSAEKLEAKVREVLGPALVARLKFESREHWNSWPRDSWWEVRISPQQMEV